MDTDKHRFNSGNRFTRLVNARFFAMSSYLCPSVSICGFIALFRFICPCDVRLRQHG